MNNLMKAPKLILLTRSLRQFEVVDFEVDNIALLKPFCRLNWKKSQKPLSPPSFIPLYKNMKMSRTTKVARNGIMYKRDEKVQTEERRREIS
jgi:hypothetical protein